MLTNHEVPTPPSEVNRLTATKRNGHSLPEWVSVCLEPAVLMIHNMG